MPKMHEKEKFSANCSSFYFKNCTKAEFCYSQPKRVPSFGFTLNRIYIKISFLTFFGSKLQAPWTEILN